METTKLHKRQLSNISTKEPTLFQITPDSLTYLLKNKINSEEKTIATYYELWTVTSFAILNMFQHQEDKYSVQTFVST